MEKPPEIQVPLPLGMKGVRVIGLQEKGGSLTIILQKDLDFGLCPTCGRVSQKIKDRHIHEVTDRPIFEKGTKIKVLKRRWKCLNSFCQVNTFTEQIQGLPKGWTHTELFYQEAYLLSRRMTYSGVYRYLQDKGSKIALSTLYQKTQQALHNKVALPEVFKTPFVGLDEFSKGKDHDYGVVLVDLHKPKVIDVADGGKTKKAAVSLLVKLDPNRVKACCIDMWKPFWSAVKQTLPKALIVIDHFHVVKQVNNALDKVRKRVQRTLRSKQKKQTLKKRKELLRMGLERLSPKQKRRLWEILSWHPHLGRAYELKELLRAIYAGQDRRKAAEELDNWIKEAISSNIAEMQEVAETLSNWREQILNFWIYRICNAVTEGKINKIKTLRRRAYNYNNFQSLRLKILEQE